MSTLLRRWGMMAGGETTDPYLANVVSLLHFNGSNGSTTFTDETGKTWTANGNAQIDTSLGYSAGKFDGTGDFISTPSHADFSFGSGLWTAEAWVYRPSATANTDMIFGKWVSGANNSFFLHVGAGSKLGIVLSVSGGYEPANDVVSAAGVVPVSTLTHLEWCRDAANVFRGYVDGVQVLTHTLAGALFAGSANVTIGGNVQVAYDANVFVRASRITKGVCRHPGGTTFTPPPPPFPS